MSRPGELSVGKTTHPYGLESRTTVRIGAKTGRLRGLVLPDPERAILIESSIAELSL